jgi:hypothetical protein
MKNNKYTFLALTIGTELTINHGAAIGHGSKTYELIKL